MSYGTVLVTGASGFLGRNVVKHFAARGCNVIGAGHGSWRQDELKSWGLKQWHDGDITLEFLRSIKIGPLDFLVHCAGGSSVPDSLASPLTDFERTVGSTSAVLDFLRLNSPATKLAYTSSAAVYGPAIRLPIAENAERNPISPYGVHKLMAENLCRMYGAVYGLNVSVIRFFSLYGRGLRKQLLWDAGRKLLSGQASFSGTGDEMRDWLHVTDAASLIGIASGKADRNCPTVNGGSGTGTTVKTIVSELSEALGIPGSGANFSGQSRAGDPLHLVSDNRSALAWGWSPAVTRQEGLADYADWCRSAV